MHLDVVWFLPHHVISVTVQQHTSQDVMGEAEDTIPPISMKEVYWEIKINKPGPRFLPELSLSGPAKVVYFDLPIYFLHGKNLTI